MCMQIPAMRIPAVVHAMAMGSVPTTFRSISVINIYLFAVLLRFFTLNYNMIAFFTAISTRALTLNNYNLTLFYSSHLFWHARDTYTTISTQQRRWVNVVTGKNLFSDTRRPQKSSFRNTYSNITICYPKTCVRSHFSRYSGHKSSRVRYRPAVVGTYPTFLLN